MLPVLQHALNEVERLDERLYEAVLLLQPTNPGRLPQDLTEALEILQADPYCGGVVSVSEPGFNPRWVCVEERDGYMVSVFQEGTTYTRRQDVPKVYRINGMLYLWRREHLLSSLDQFRQAPKRMLVVPKERAIDIDDLYDFRIADFLIRNGWVSLPWMESVPGERQPS
jgi:N-acylneuraminate cytidylyltransferase